MKILNGIHQGWKAPLAFVQDQNPEYVLVSDNFFSFEGRREHCVPKVTTLQ